MTLSTRPNTAGLMSYNPQIRLPLMSLGNRGSVGAVIQYSSYCEGSTARFRVTCWLPYEVRK